MQASVVAANIIACIALCGCAGEKNERTPERTVGTGSAECDMTPFDRAGTLRACAAGTSSADGPGGPFDFDKTRVKKVVKTAAQLKAIAEANTLAAARNPASQSPVDRGFAPPPATSGSGK